MTFEFNWTFLITDQGQNWQKQVVREAKQADFADG